MILSQVGPSALRLLIFKVVSGEFYQHFFEAAFVQSVYCGIERALTYLVWDLQFAKEAVLIRNGGNRKVIIPVQFHLTVIAQWMAKRVGLIHVLNRGDIPTMTGLMGIHAFRHDRLA